MATYTLRDIDGELWQRFATCGQLEGWGPRELLLSLIAGYVEGKTRPPDAPPRPRPETSRGTVLLHFTCPKCHRPMTVEAEAGSRGFSIMSFYAIACPHCHQATDRMLPGAVVAIAKNTPGRDDSA